jgi:hypothetical protein
MAMDEVIPRELLQRWGSQLSPRAALGRPTPAVHSQSQERAATLEVAATCGHNAGDRTVGGRVGLSPITRSQL